MKDSPANKQYMALNKMDIEFGSKSKTNAERLERLNRMGEGAFLLAELAKTETLCTQDPIKIQQNGGHFLPKI